MRIILTTFILLFSMTFVTSISSEEIWSTFSDIGYINDIEAQGDYLWCGTTGGVVKVDLRDKSYTVFRTLDGLVDDNVNDVAIDSTGVVWFGTENGLSSFNGEQWTSYTEMNGLTNKEVSRIDIRSDGAIYITTQGFRYGIGGGYATGLQRIQYDEWETLVNMKDLDVDPLYFFLDNNHQCLWSPFMFGYFKELDFNGEFVKNHVDQGNDYASTVPSGSELELTADSDNVTWFAGQGLWSYDGTTWTNVVTQTDSVLTGDIQSVFAEGNNTKWIGSTDGLYRFDGESWEQFLLDDELDYIYNILRGGNGELYGSTDKGIAYFDGEKVVLFDDGKPVSVTIETPQLVDVVSVYPNPFNPSTTISYSLAETGCVKLSVYSISGQKVAILVDNDVSAGRHSVAFDGSNLASGVYFYQFQTEGFNKTGKMLIVK